MMKTSDSSNACPKCGAPVPVEAPQGLCPKCVLAEAMAPESAPTATAYIPSLERLAVAFPQLQILELIGRGGMGFVFKARQPHLDRFVALKLLPDSLAHDPSFAERFNREGRTLARLNHPNIVSIFDFGYARSAGVLTRSGLAEAQSPKDSVDSSGHRPAAAEDSRAPEQPGFYFLLMEYVDGVNLRQAMQAGKFSPSEALAIVPKICEALQFAHEEGVLHRDIKPENILLDAKGRVKIADFGIAKIVGDNKPDASLTATGTTLGTPHYMAPEQFEKPATVDHRADIYSLGVVFYEMLTGELPIGRFSPPSQRTPVDPRVDDVVMRTLEKEREKRFQSAGEMGTTVEHLTEAGAGATAPTLAPAEDFILCPPRLPRMAKAVIVYALVLAPLFWLLGLFTIEPLPKQALVAFIQGALNAVVGVAEFLVLIVFAIGGWKLRGLRSSATGWLKTAIWLHLALTGVAIAGAIWVAVLTEQLIPDAPDRLHMYDGIVLAVLLATTIFEISALVWLHRHTTLLKSLCPRATKTSGPRGTMVITPADVLPTAPKWSLKAVWGAVLVGISLLPAIALLAFLTYLAASRRGAIGGWEIFAALILSLPSIGGTILGWMALNDIRVERLRGLPLAVFAALALPLLVLIGVTVVIPSMISFRPSVSGTGIPLPAMLMLLVPAGTITFTIWAVYAAARWGANKPPSQPRGVLKWVFLALVTFGISLVLLHNSSARRSTTAQSPQASSSVEPARTETEPRIRFTFTAVELREVKGVRWLAIDYLDDVRGEAEKSFPWETTIPGFKAETRTSEFLGGDKNAPVRHQRTEYRMPDSAPRDQLEQFRNDVAKKLIHRTFHLEPHERQMLFEIVATEGGSLKAWIKVMPPSKLPARSGSPEYLKAATQLEDLQKQERELLQRYTSTHPVVIRKRTQIEAAQREKARLQGTSLTEPASNSLALQFRLVADDADTAAPVDVMMEARGDETSVPHRVLRTVLLDGSAVARAGIVLETNGQRTIGIELTTEGARQFGAITASNIMRQLAIVANGRVLSAPIIRSPISGGELTISGGMTAAETHKLVAVLNRTMTEFAFSEPVERTLPYANEHAISREAVFLDLASGNFVTNRSWRRYQSSTRDWARTNHADLIAYGPAGSATLWMGQDLVSIEAAPNAWDSMLPEDVAWNWKLMRSSAQGESQFLSGFLSLMPDRSDTFLVRTRDDRVGLLQIPPATYTSQHVKIRYKLVQALPVK